MKELLYIILVLVLLESTLEFIYDKKYRVEYVRNKPQREMEISKVNRLMDNILYK